MGLGPRQARARQASHALRDSPDRDGLELGLST
jgi:hypothetical protein